MLGAVEQVRNPVAINPRLLPAIDQLLIAGIKLGPNKKHEAINKILKLVPEWKRGDCWRRIRQLRRTPALASEAPQELKNADENGSSHRAPSRPWLSEDDAKLLDLAGYEPVNEIAERLERSERAVRFRLGALGMSARVTDGWVTTLTTKAATDEPHSLAATSCRRLAASSRSACHPSLTRRLLRETRVCRFLRVHQFTHAQLARRTVLLETSSQAVGFGSRGCAETRFSRTTETCGHVCDRPGFRRVLQETWERHQYGPDRSLDEKVVGQ